MTKYDQALKQYDYRLSPERIALRPASPRDAAKLLIYNRKTRKTVFDVFKNLDRYLPHKAVLVLNDTKVVPARFYVRLGRKQVELFYVGVKGRNLRCLANRSMEPGTVLRLGKIIFKILGREERWYVVRPSFPVKNIFNFLEKYGHTPLPPYLEHSPLSEKKRRQKYQTVFAAAAGSVAAPTAALHFTDRLLKKIAARGIQIIRVTLHINLGTFAPLDEGNFKSGKLHREEFQISPRAAKFLNQAKQDGRKIIAVGTTAARALESASVRRGRVAAGAGETRLFIRPPYRFNFVDGLVTNFHVPRSSLLMLVAALIGRKKLLGLYSLALKNKMKFLSFGDGMFIF
jgi:S-adenosylmethionine:tRNA ribosyltransferase-isomerase